MDILQITDKAFGEFGRIVKYQYAYQIVEALEKYTPLPETVEYVPEETALQNLDAAKKLANSLYGGMEVQFGWCNGHNTKLNCLEYHKDSEYNIGTEDFILLLAKQSDIKQNNIDSSAVKAFVVPKGVLVEVYATSMHYAPCQAHIEKGFRVMVALPKGTNYKKPEFSAQIEEDKLLWAKNKWLLAHSQSNEAKQGAYIGITGENIDIAKYIK
ncbi:DUF4867 family protein [Lachnospiraceae bacterium 46-61]